MCKLSNPPSHTQIYFYKPPPERDPVAPSPGPSSLRCCHPRASLGCLGPPSKYRSIIESYLLEWIETARGFELGASTASMTGKLSHGVGANVEGIAGSLPADPLQVLVSKFCNIYIVHCFVNQKKIRFE